MIPPVQSLVKYDTPVLVSTTSDKKKDKTGKRTVRARARVAVRGARAPGRARRC